VCLTAVGADEIVSPQTSPSAAAAEPEGPHPGGPSRGPRRGRSRGPRRPGKRRAGRSAVASQTQKAVHQSGQRLSKWGLDQLIALFRGRGEAAKR
jgi:hypothetical protein